MIYIVDHKDSFTYNLVHLFSEFDVVCIANYFEVNYSKMAKSELIVFLQVQERLMIILLPLKFTKI